MIYFRDREYFGVINEYATNLPKKISLKDGFAALKKQYEQNGTNQTFVDYAITIYNNSPERYTETSTVPDASFSYTTEYTEENDKAAEYVISNTEQIANLLGNKNNDLQNQGTGAGMDNASESVMVGPHQLTLEQYNFLYN